MSQLRLCNLHQRLAIGRNRVPSPRVVSTEAK